MSDNDVDKENTWRALQDQDLLMVTPKRCAFGFHKWTKWREVSRKIDSNSWGNYYTQLHLRKDCVNCGIAEGKRLNLPIVDKTGLT